MTEHLRQSFAQAFERDFDILADAMRQRNNARFWVVSVRPRRSGTFYFRHEYQQAEGYRHHDDESRIIVLEKGAPRSLRYDLNPQSICVGDTLLVPFAANPNTSQHRFRGDSRFPQYFDGPFATALDSTPLTSVAAGPLRYLGRELFYAIHRAPARASLAFHAYFEATQPGRTNLTLSAHLPAAMAQDGPAPALELVVLSIQVAPPDSAIVVLLASVSAHAFDTPAAVSTGWAKFPTTVMALRPGDRFSTTYGWMTVGNTPQTRAQAAEVTPRITISPFAIDRAHLCNSWLLPASAAR